VEDRLLALSHTHSLRRTHTLSNRPVMTLLQQQQDQVQMVNRTTARGDRNTQRSASRRSSKLVPLQHVDLPPQPPHRLPLPFSLAPSSLCLPRHCPRANSSRRRPPSTNLPIPQPTSTNPTPTHSNPSPPSISSSSGGHQFFWFGVFFFHFPLIINPSTSLSDTTTSLGHIHSTISHSHPHRCLNAVTAFFFPLPPHHQPKHVFE